MFNENLNTNKSCDSYQYKRNDLFLFLFLFLYVYIIYTQNSINVHVSLQIPVLGIGHKYGFREKFMLKTQHFLLESSNNRCSHVEDPSTHCLTALYVQTVERRIVTRKICCVIEGWNVARSPNFNACIVLIKPLRKGICFCI